ncbi:MAG: hypothetical protein UZ21_OP11001000505 [Microgenomates bacterium OLB22]|nr:MAG: hypothetical protein UZ21_OP11001000505 [Microgenomates bacterium OLB22]
MEGYAKILHEEIVHCIAITDHNEIDFALEAQKKFGVNVIVGEEIRAREGEIIGLFLSKKIPAGLSVMDTIYEIRNQGGIVYVPHPFDIVRHGVSYQDLLSVLPSIDVIEIFNSRSISRRENARRRQLASDNNIVGGVGSDAHSYSEVGKTYSLVCELPDVTTFLPLLKTATHTTAPTSLIHRLNPFINKVKKRWHL